MDQASTLDPRRLFTPEPQELSSNLTSLRPTPDSPPSLQNLGPSPPSTFYVGIPVLPSALKKEYKLPEEVSLASEVNIGDLDEIIGEFRDGRKVYYFARFKKGPAYKFIARALELKYPALVEVYERRKAEGSLPLFDPSAQYVHRKSRIRNIVSIKNMQVRKPHAQSSDDEMEVVPDSEEEDELAADDGEYNSDIPELVRNSRRAATASKVLPYSPRKTRSQKLYLAMTDPDEESSSEEEARPMRRSTRTRKVVKLKLDGDSFAEDSDAEDEEVYLPSRKSKDKKTKPKHRKASRPAYGHFRPVADLDYDPYSDEETAPLREHRSLCERCARQPTHTLLADFEKRQKNKRRKRKTDDDDLEDSEDEKQKLSALGGWIRCLKCPASYHWHCLARSQRDEILNAACERDRAEWRIRQSHIEVYDENGIPKPHPAEPVKRKELEVSQMTEFICAPCMKGGICMHCMETALEADSVSKGLTAVPLISESQPVDDGDHEMADAGDISLPADASLTNEPLQLLFRCFTCKRLAHYSHLPPPDGLGDNPSLASIAASYQDDGWLCSDCLTFNGQKVEHILAWRPYPPSAIESPSAPYEPPNYKSQLPREYLVKWVDRSYKRIHYVPHMWLAATHPGKLRNFLIDGPKIELLPHAIEDDEAMAIGEESTSAPTFESTEDPSRESSVKGRSHTPSLGRGPLADAERRIPPAWKTIDRVLDVRLWYPRKRKITKKPKGKYRKGKPSQIDSEESTSDEDHAMNHPEYQRAFSDGIQPDAKLMESIFEWEKRNHETFTLSHLHLVVWIFAKWDDLNYDDSTWDSPPRPEDLTYPAFQTAMERYLNARKVRVKIGPPKEPNRKASDFDKEEFLRKHRLHHGGGLDLGQNEKLKLMDFQVDGFNWLCSNWWNLQPCILADEMGLGKTVQVTSFLGHIIKKFDASPALVVVPNSTLTNWIREFERWAPNLRVVPWYGEAKARDIIRDYELYHDSAYSGCTHAKFHVLVTTYEALTNQKDFSTIFKKQPRWEILVVDEGQRLKSDSSLIFRKLKELNTMHRVIMTGTPLNNNIRELFNLMNFLDPGQWKDLQALEREYETLTEDLVKQLHTRLRPYFLRRIKTEVLQLPPKNEVIVPVSMAPLQKEIYKSILSHNLDLLKGLTTQPLASMAPKKTKLNNVLMELRKCLQHPYLYASDIEPVGLSGVETHEKLIDASAKLRLLKQFLPKLKTRGHRVLLFSQFVIALDIIEDFLNGEGIKSLRLDGNTKNRDRQKGMDEFNRPGSDVFIYLLSTRAGGVGINLFSADTVIIFDPDFNPHQDLQAIARAHRFGQQKTVLVFKLMVKDSAEERIMQVGKKKLVLDHLIVQKMEDEDSVGEDVQSILTYGAKALFEDSEGSSRDIVYTENDLDKLIEKTETETAVPATAEQGTGFTFSFAKVWAADKDTLEEVEESNDQGDAWAQTLQKITAEREKTQVVEAAKSGRGARRRAAQAKRPNAYVEQTPTKLSGRPTARSEVSDGSAYGGESAISDFDSDDPSVVTHIDNDLDLGNVAATSVLPGQEPKVNPPKVKNKRQRKNGRTTPISAVWVNPEDETPDICGLCGGIHGSQEGDCPMTQHSDFLVEFRRMLLLNTDDEPLETRRMAIKAIDETLYKRGEVHLIQGQPLFLVEDLPVFPVNPTTRHHPSEQVRSPVDTTGPSQGWRPAAMDYSAQVSGSVMGYPLQVATAYTEPNAGASSSRQTLPPQYSSEHHFHPMPATNASKRPASPLEHPVRKKESILDGCPVCLSSPHHLIKDCPIVLGGPSNVAREIARLDKDPTMSDTVSILRKILKKQKKRELEMRIGA